MTLDEAFEAYRRQARGRHGRPPMGFSMIPKEFRADAHAVYVFARTTHDFANEDFGTLGKKERLQLLAHREAEFGRCLKGESADPEFATLRRTIESRRLPADLFRELISAGRQDVEKLRYADFAEVKEYCRKSANPIGRLILNIFGCRDEEMLRQGDRIACGFQLAHLWQRVGADLERDKIYLPQDEMENFGVDDAMLKERRFDEGILRLMQFQVRRTREVLDSPKRLCAAVDRRFRPAIRLAWLTATEMLNKIENQGFDVLRKTCRLSKLDRVGLLPRALIGGSG